MPNSWLSLLDRLPLSRTEREVVKRFEADADGRTFLPIADILRSHRLVDESLELLTHGVERHPTFSVARVVLARELLQKGLVESAYRTLESTPVPLGENILAQKLRFRLAILLGKAAEARATYQHMHLHQMVDADTKRVADVLDVTGFAAAKDKLTQEMRQRGTELVLPVEAFETRDEPPSTAAHEGPAFAPISGNSRPMARDREEKFTAGGVSAFYDASAVERDASLAGFHVVPLEEVFRPEGDAPAGTRGASAPPSGVELDSTTLADIYARQGHYGRALSVYRRMLKMTPGNELLRRKVAELARLEREQKSVDLTIDPAVVDRMETVEIIDRQIRFYNDLLGRLT